MKHIDLLEEINSRGIDKIRFFVPMHPLESDPFDFIHYKSLNSPEHLVECYISEERYKISENYKITLVAVDEQYGYESYYICDLESLIQSDIVFIKEEGEYVKTISYEEPPCCGLKIRHSGEIIAKGDKSNAMRNK
jgi:hypothetical protein